MTCPYLLQLPVEKRSGNHLNVEIGTPICRCQLKPPSEWTDQNMASRWLNSGGSPLVFGACTPKKCPAGIEWNRCDLGCIRQDDDGSWWLLNRQDKGWNSFGYRAMSLEQLEKDHNVVVLEQERDSFGEYYRFAKNMSRWSN